VPRAPLALVVAVTLLAACGGERRGATGSGGVLVIATPGDADILLPPLSATGTGRNAGDRIFPRLAELTLELNTIDDSGFAPSLAERWEHRDSTTIVFHLDRRARWQDGVPVTARDVAFTFALYTDSALGSGYRPNLAQIASVTPEDSFTVAFAFRRWYPEQLYDATYHMRVLPRHLLDTIPAERLGSAAFARAPVGIGPYRFVRWTPGAEIVVAADSGYFRGRPRLDRIVWRLMPDVSSGVSALIAGEVDAIEVIPQPAELDRAARDSNLVLMPYASPILMFVAFNLRRPPFDDRALRRALSFAVDRATMVRSVFGPYGEVPVGATSRMQWIAALPVRQLLYDTAAAARTLDSLGWRTGPGGVRVRAGRPLRFTLILPVTSAVRRQGAVLLQEQLRRVGVDMQIQPVDLSVLEQRSGGGAFDAAFIGRSLDASPSALVGDWTSDAVAANYGAYRSAAFDSLVLAAVAAPTRERAAPLFRAALEQINDDAPALFLFSPRNNAVIHRRYANVTIRPDAWLATVHEWGIPTDRRLPRDAAVAAR
jgi:peptide/nickel transport system substrate-binding protein